MNTGLVRNTPFAWDGGGQREYKLVIHPDADVYDKIMTEKQRFAAKYGTETVAKSFPYILVGGFYAGEGMEETLIRWIQRICSQHNSFDIILNNYSGFPQHTIYLRIQNPHPLQQLARQLKTLDNHVLSMSGATCAEPDDALAQARNAPLRALALAGADYQAERRAWIRAFAAPAKLEVAAMGARIDAAPREQRREVLAAVVDWLLGWCSDLARVHAGAEPAENLGFEKPLRELAASVAAVALFRYHRQLLKQRALLAHPLSPRLVAEALIIDYRALFG